MMTILGLLKGFIFGGLNKVWIYSIGALGALLAYLAWAARMKSKGRQEAENRMAKQIERQVAKSEAIEREVSGTSPDAVREWLRNYRG